MGLAWFSVGLGVWWRGVGGAGRRAGVGRGGRACRAVFFESGGVALQVGSALALFVGCIEGESGIGIEGVAGAGLVGVLAIGLEGGQETGAERGFAGDSEGWF